MVNQKELPKVGIISPVGEVPPETTYLYGDSVQFTAGNANVKALTPEGYEAAINNMPMVVDQLVQSKVDAISIMGTSLTFFRGRAFNESIQKSVAEQSGLPAVTMTTAVMEGLKTLNAKKVAVATAYSREVTDLLTSVLKEYEFESTNSEYLDADMSIIRDLTTEKIVQLGCRAVENTNADTLLISCGGLRTIEATAQLEEKLGIPVVSSAIAGAWAGVRLVGHSGYASVGGKLLQTSKP